MRNHSRSFCIAALALIASTLAFAAGPQVTKVEPPNWWIGLPPSPMLLLTGANLAGAQVTTSYAGVRIDRVQVQPGGRYLFVWLDVSATARPGTAALKVQTDAGATVVDFPLATRDKNSRDFQGLSPSDVIYLIMPDRFDDGDTTNNEPAPDLKTYDRTQPKAWHGGDLQGIDERLPYLRDLGVTALWLTPFWKNDWRAEDHSYHGYHVMDFYAVDEHLGTIADLQRLVRHVHRQGMKFTLDYVVNHIGPHHPWASDPPVSTWLHGTAGNHLSPAYDFAPLVDPHAVPRQQRPVLEGWFADRLPDLNPDDPLLAQYLLQNVEWWLEMTGADAVRLDTLPYSTRSFWSGWHEGLFRVFPKLMTIGEVWNGDPFITSFFAGGRKEFDGIDSRVSTVFDFPMWYVLRDVLLRGAPVNRIPEVLEHDALYPHPDTLVTFIGNHDTARFMGEEGASIAKLKAAFALLLTLRGIPQIYSGDEIGMDGGGDPDNRRDFPGGFPGDSQNAFAVSGRTADQQNIRVYVQALLRLRREHPALCGGRLWHIGLGDNYYAFLRESGNDRLLVVFNSSAAPNNIVLSLDDTPLANVRSVKPVLAAAPAALQGQSLQIQGAPVSVAIYEIR